ncbi:MAG: hypothetical protein ABR909_12165 [Candidatus Bathyarchaeia archaeon]|jgi:hypothetical protein
MHITFRGDRNNNKMERMNGEVRGREKVMRGLKINETPILKATNYSTTISDLTKV